MGGVHVDADTQMSRRAGIVRRGRMRRGINGANRLGGNSLSDLLVFGKRAGEYAAKFAKENAAWRRSTSDRSTRCAREALQPFENSAGENPYRSSAICRKLMQDNVGIVRDEERNARRRWIN